MEIALLYRARHDGASLPARPTGALTGFRLFADGFAYELIEGEFSAVCEAFADTLAAPHLSAVEMLSNAAITRRVCTQWSQVELDEGEDLPADLAAKVQMLHHLSTRFGATQPVLRDFLARIGEDLAAPPRRRPPVAAAGRGAGTARLIGAA